MDLTYPLRRRDVAAVVNEFRLRHLQDRMPAEEAENDAVRLTVSVFRIVDEATASYGEPVPPPVTPDEARAALTREVVTS